MITPRVRMLAALAGLLGLALAGAVAARPVLAAQPGNPMAGAPYYVDSKTAAARAAGAARAAHRPGEAAALRVIARTPQSRWFTAPDDPLASPFVRDYFARWHARAPGSLLVISLHGLPNQVCAGENRPGMNSARRYRRWIDRWVRRIRSQRVDVFLEPDALPAASCLSGAARKERFSLIAYAARRLSRLPHTGVYIDAGAGDWLNPGAAARLLRLAGVRWARGFSLNTTHFDWTSAEVRYGAKVGRMLGGKHFVVNTAFNGRGPEVHGYYHEWCNPRGRALGPLPTTRTYNRLADGFFWLGSPGFSDGHCNGGPRVGAFWVQWALELVRNASHARDFPFLGAHK